MEFWMHIGLLTHLFYLLSTMFCRFAVMACCWALDPEERPKFQQLVQCLTEFHAALGAYVWRQNFGFLLKNKQQNQKVMNSTNLEEFMYEIVPYQRKEQTFALTFLFCTVLWGVLYSWIVFPQHSQKWTCFQSRVFFVEVILFLTLWKHL